MTGRGPQSTRSPCNTRLGVKNHRILHSHKTIIPLDENEDVGLEITNEMLQCCGCDEVSFRQSVWFSEAPYDIDVSHFPPRAKRRIPKWVDQLPKEISSLLSETYHAVAVDARALATMGIRGIIDEVCNNKVDDCGGFEKKLKALVDGEFISSYQKEVLDAAIDAGSAATHRAYRPKPQEVEGLLDIVEHLLQGAYVLRGVAKDIEERTPRRNKRS